MGLFRWIGIAGVIGTSVVVLNQRETGAGIASDLRVAGEQAVAVKDYCSARPDVCATLAGSAATLARQELAARLEPKDRAAIDTTGQVNRPAGASSLPAHPPLPPRRPAAFP